MVPRTTCGQERTRGLAHIAGPQGPPTLSAPRGTTHIGKQEVAARGGMGITRMVLQQNHEVLEAVLANGKDLGRR